jgi:hypothetical protein
MPAKPHSRGVRRHASKPFAVAAEADRVVCAAETGAVIPLCALKGLPRRHRLCYISPMRKILVALALFVALPVIASVKSKVYQQGTRLAAILQDAQTNAAITDNSWNHIGREANSLANGIISDLANTFREQHKIALEVHREIFAMRVAAARDGNAEQARAHARKALVPLAKLLEWSAPR